jgi:hypothetical protein
VLTAKTAYLANRARKVSQVPPVLTAKTAYLANRVTRASRVKSVQPVQPVLLAQTALTVLKALKAKWVRKAIKDFKANLVSPAPSVPLVSRVKQAPKVHRAK